MDRTSQSIEPVEVLILGSKALVLDEKRGNELFKQFFGKPFGVQKPKPETEYRGPFILSLYEALYLCKRGVLKPVIQGREASCDELASYARSQIPDFDAKYLVYENLRTRGYVVRSGLKFGADFAVYEIGPGYEHAPYVVLVARRGIEMDPISIVRIGRVSHSVRKRTVLAIVDPETKTVNYLVFKWVKL